MYGNTFKNHCESSVVTNIEFFLKEKGRTMHLNKARKTDMHENKETACCNKTTQRRKIWGECCALL